MSDSIESICEGGSPAELSKYSYWTSEVYGFGNIIREYGYYPSWLPLFISTDHGPAQHDVPNALELQSHAWAHFYHSPRLIDEWKKVSERRCYNLYSPFVFYRRKHKIQQTPTAKGTIVFPTHSTHLIDVEKDWELYIQELKALPQEYHPIDACLYFLDVQKGLHKVFERHGIGVHSAGNWLDPRFPERFYNIIKNYRYATASQTGSYLFYCVEMGLPFFIMGSTASQSNNGDKNVDASLYVAQAKYSQLAKVNQIFSHGTHEISEEQRLEVYRELGLLSGVSRLKMAYILYRALVANLFHSLRVSFTG